MERPQVVQVLKRDVFGRVERLEGPAGPMIRRVSCGGRLPLSRAVARILARRERRALERAAGLTGLPRALEAPAYAAAASPEDGAPRRADVLLRSFLPGEPLHRATELPRNFFDLLEVRVRALHARGVCHNDLHKEQNIMVLPGGAPALIDFQLASCHTGTGRLFASRVGDDLRHVAKHRRRYELQGRRDPEAHARASRVPRRSTLAALWRKTGKPAYNFLTRRVLKRRDGEERRASSGPWPRWSAALDASELDASAPLNHTTSSP